ncbi:MAG: hypothetical protein QCI82_03295 [Candidatus Thermoplasmatota archaeon]|nr:hypothetical protein [Candidatus Thermoplasmatota archaeon]
MIGRNKIYLLGAVLIVAMLLIHTDWVNAYGASHRTCIAGAIPNGGGVGEDPFGQAANPKNAKHPQNDAWKQYVVSVYSMQTNQFFQGRFIWNIRLAISNDHGETWSIFEWVKLDSNNDQDYPDVHIYHDSTDLILKLVVVWQERPAVGGPWKILARERFYLHQSGVWGSTYTVSEPGDQQDNIYPKVSTTSGSGGEQWVTYWNVVWQRYYFIHGTYGVKLNIFSRYKVGNTITEGFVNNPQDIAVPTSSNEEYKHPATDCIFWSDYDGIFEVVYIIYEAKLPLVQDPEEPPIQPYRVRVEGGDLSGVRGPYVRQVGPIDLDWGSSDNIGYPDISVIGQTTGTGFTVDCVWVRSSNVMYSQSTNSGGSYSTPLSIASNGDLSMRSVAIDSNKYSWGTYFNLKLVVIWTDGSDIYFRIRLGNDGQGWLPFQTTQTLSSGEALEDFVDVAVKMSSQNMFCYVHFVWQEASTAVWYDRDIEDSEP